ncbi:MAG: hypothetical protein JO016_10565 [Actinobacteria bacterium]|nr:hypothetical protein [Actinomycetota bacterium]
MPRRGELLAAIGVLLVLFHVIFAQLTLILALVFFGVTKVTRWRPAWLELPAAAGLLWTLAIGPATALAGFTAGPALVASYLGGIGGDSSRLLHLGVAYAGMGQWLPRQLPVALMTGAAEAALAAWLDWLHTDEWDVRPPRPGLAVTARRAAVTAAVRSGGVVARDGARLGVDEVTGLPATLSWAEVAGGVLVAGSARSGTSTSSFQLVQAAIRLRKPVIVVDLGGHPGLATSLATLCAAVDAPFHEFSATGPASYEPFRVGSPARRATLVTAMINWAGTIDYYRQSFASYLGDVFELIEAAPADRRIPVLDDVAHLLDPLALEARLAQVPAYHPRRAALAGRIRAAARLAREDPAILMTAASQLTQLRESPIGRWLRPAPAATGAAGGGHIDLGRVVRERAVVLFSLGSGSGPGGQASAAARLAWLIGQDILATDRDLREIGIDGDGLAWFDHCEGLPQPILRDLIGNGTAAGLPVMLTTTSARAAAGLVAQVNALVIHRMPDPDSAAQFAAQTGQRLVPEAWGGPGAPELTTAPRVPASTLQELGRGRFVLVTREPAGRLVTAGRTIPAALPDRAHATPPGSASSPPASPAEPSRTGTRWPVPAARRPVGGDRSSGGDRPAAPGGGRPAARDGDRPAALGPAGAGPEAS